MVRTNYAPAITEDEATLRREEQRLLGRPPAFECVRRSGGARPAAGGPMVGDVSSRGASGAAARANPAGQGAAADAGGAG